MTTRRTLYIRNLVKTTREIGDDLYQWAANPANQGGKQCISQQETQSIFRKISAARIEANRILDENKASAANLPIRSRRAYQWLVFLSEESCYRAHLKTLLDMVETWNTMRSRQTDLTISLYHIGDLYRIRQRGSCMALTAHESFISAGPEVIRALMTLIQNPHHKRSKQVLNLFAASEEHFSIRQEMEGLEIVHRDLTRGAHHDLMAVFRRVNRKYFQNTLKTPILTWNQQLTYRKFGHYQFSSDVVMISRSLDQAHIPDYVLDYVMYHELLHKKLGYRVVNGRRLAHTAHFRAREKQFEKLAQAQNFLERLSRRLAG